MHFCFSLFMPFRSAFLSRLIAATCYKLLSLKHPYHQLSRKTSKTGFQEGQIR